MRIQLQIFRDSGWLRDHTFHHAHWLVDVTKAAVLASIGISKAHQAVQAMGGTEYMNESTVSRLMRDAKLMEIGAGTSEIRRMLIGRELMGAMG